MIDRDELLAIVNDPTRSLDEIIRTALVARMLEVMKAEHLDDESHEDWLYHMLVRGRSI